MRKKEKKDEERKQNHGNVEETRDQKEYLRDAYLNGTRGKEAEKAYLRLIQISAVLKMKHTVSILP